MNIKKIVYCSLILHLIPLIAMENNNLPGMVPAAPRLSAASPQRVLMQSFDLSEPEISFGNTSRNDSPSLESLVSSVSLRVESPSLEIISANDTRCDMIDSSNRSTSSASSSSTPSLVRPPSNQNLFKSLLWPKVLRPSPTQRIKDSQSPSIETTCNDRKYKIKTQKQSPTITHKVKPQIPSPTLVVDQNDDDNDFNILYNPTLLNNIIEQGDFRTISPSIRVSIPSPLEEMIPEETTNPSNCWPCAIQ